MKNRISEFQNLGILEKKFSSVLRFCNSKILIILASVFALSVALISQYGFGLHPCELCIWQRWAYAAVIFFSVLSLRSSAKQYREAGLLRRYAPRNDVLIALTLVITCAIATYHFGIEQKWWEGFSTCSSSFGAKSIEDIKAQIMAAPAVRCDESKPFLFGLSMAGWNVIYSFSLFLVAIIRIK